MIIIVMMFGVLIGSFLNVVIYRLPLGESIVFPSSKCTSCNTNLQWYDNIPVLSYIRLKGKCRYCSDKVSIQYPLIEIITGVVFGYLYKRTGLTPELIFQFVLMAILICVVVIDMKHEIIPDQLNVLLLVCGSIFMLTKYGVGLSDGLYGLLIGGGLLFFIALAGPMGGGDIKFMAAMGLWLGLFPTILALLIAFILGGIMGVILIVTKVKERKDHIPFGPFLVMGSIIGHFYFNEFILFYLKFL